MKAPQTMLILAAAVFALFAAATCLAQGSGGSRGALPPVWTGPWNSDLVGKAPANGPRAPKSVHRVLHGSTLVRVDASPPWDSARAPRPSAAGLEKILSLLDTLNVTYARRLQLPKVVELRFFPVTGLEGSWLGETGYGLAPSRYDITTGVLVAGEYIGTDSGLLQSPELSAWITVHEYGHAIFASSMAARVPDVRRLMESYGEAGGFRRSQAALGPKTRGGLACTLNPQAVELLRDPDERRSASDSEAQACETWAQIQELLAPVEKAILANPAFPRLAAYDELFADLVAVVLSGDLDVMVRSLAIPRMSDDRELRERASLRSFANCASPKEISQSWARSHDYFAPARCELGSVLVSTRDRAAFLAQVLDVLALDLTEAIRESKPRNLIAENERLIQRIRQSWGRP
jgi:hypothetical protein